MNHTLSRLDGQSMCSQSNVLCLLQCLRLQKGEATLPDGRDDGEIGEARGLHRYVDDDRVVCELVEVGYRLDKDGRGGGYGGEFAGADWGKAREKRVRILLDGNNL